MMVEEEEGSWGAWKARMISAVLPWPWGAFHRVSHRHPSPRPGLPPFEGFPATMTPAPKSLLKPCSGPC